MAGGKTRAGIYVRISSDPLGRRAGVERQRQDCLELCERRLWDVVDVYEDNDLSAYSGRRRPAYERLCDDVTQSVVDTVVCWHPDRLHRHPRELEDFIQIIEAAGANVQTVTAGDWDLSTPDGRLVARILGSVSRKESEDKSRRVARKKRELAEQGRPNGGGSRPFGYEADHRTVNEHEATLVRGAIDRVLCGDSLRSVWLEWCQQGITTTNGKLFAPSSLRRVLTSPRIAGLRVHQGEVIGEAVWPAIIDRATHEQLIARLSDPSRTLRRMPPRKYLLTGGLLRCALCGQPMVARPKADGRRCYVCARYPGRPNCGRMRCLAEPLEAEVVARVMEALDGPTLTAIMADVPGGRDHDEARLLATELQMLNVRVDALERAHFVDGELSAGRYRSLRAELERRHDGLQSRLASRTRSGRALRLPSSRAALERWWDDADIEHRRALLELVLERVDIKPAVKGRRPFDPDRVRLAWRA
jgi:site-specific DNA recombinase